MLYILYKDLNLFIALPVFTFKNNLVIKYLNKISKYEILQSIPVRGKDFIYSIACVYNPLNYIYQKYIYDNVNKLNSTTNYKFINYCYGILKDKQNNTQNNKQKEKNQLCGLTEDDNYMDYDAIIYDDKISNAVIMDIIKFLCKTGKVSPNELYNMKMENYNKFPFDYMMYHDTNTIKMTSIIYWEDFKYFNIAVNQILPADLPKYKLPPKDEPLFTLITPTIGKPSLMRLLFTLEMEDTPFQHFIMWDKKRFNRFNGGVGPNDCKGDRIYNYEFTHPHNTERADVWLRALGVFMADSEFYGFFDEDTFPMRNHLKKIADLFNSNNDVEYIYCKRIMWEEINNSKVVEVVDEVVNVVDLEKEKKNNDNFNNMNDMNDMNDDGKNIIFSSNNYKKIGVDNFEAIGKTNKFGYRLYDNSSLYMRKNIARLVAANIYMNNQVYGDDRLTPDYLDKIGAKGIIMEEPLINHIAREDLVPFFKANIIN